MHLLNYSVSRVGSFLACAALLAAAGCATQPTQSTAGVLRIRGAAQWSNDNGATWQTLERRQKLSAGSMIRTAADSRVDLQFGQQADATMVRPNASPRNVDMHPASPTSQRPGLQSGAGRVGTSELLVYTSDDCVLRIWGSSILSIDRLTIGQTGADEVSDTALDLRAGHIYGKVKKLAPGSSYRVRIPNGIATIRGTVYDLTVEGLLKVRAGAVVLNYTTSDGTSKTQTVTSDQRFDARTGELTPLSDLDKQSMVMP